MLDVAPTELLLVAVVALVVIGPKDLPRVMRTVGHWIGRARGVARHFRSGIDTMIRESELEEMEAKWKAENDRILKAHPQTTAEAEQIAMSGPQPMLPLPDQPVEQPEAEPASLPPVADDEVRPQP